MIEGEDLPAVNAVLNGSSTVLLTVGYIAIRRRLVKAHIACMLAALAVSTLFLVSYSYYHIAVKGGDPTPFRGEGWVRGLYYAILWSHIVLAAVISPLAVYTAYLGLSAKWARHVRIARWIFPVWLYVSVTGVVVYAMLYQLYPQPG
jgi:uncharacterized membrane protein YozB (DUF420 family)